MTSDSREPYLIIIRSGPVSRLEGKLHHIAQVFQRRFEGEILTWGHEFQVMHVGRIQVRRWALAWERPPHARLAYMAKVVWRALRARWLLRRRLVVVSYDPFQSGLIALIMKWLTGASFICEVNGAYADSRTFIEIEDPEARRSKQETMMKVGSRVLRRCDGIKLLFPEQIQGFGVEGNHPPRFCFPNLVDVDTFQPSGMPRAKRILFVGQPFHLKGVDLLLGAFAQVAGDHPEWELHCLGWKLREGAGSVDFPQDQVRFFDPVDPGKVAPMMEGAAFLVLPSRSEGMGRVLLEAAHLGLPRVGSDVGGIPTVIDDGVDGLIFPSGDMGALAEALETLISDVELRERMGRAARVRAKNEFTEENYLAQWDRILARVASDRLPSSSKKLQKMAESRSSRGS